MKTMSEFMEEALKRMPNDAYVAVQCDLTRYAAGGKINVAYRASCIPEGGICKQSSACSSPEEAVNGLIVEMYPPIKSIQADIIIPETTTEPKEGA